MTIMYLVKISCFLIFSQFLVLHSFSQVENEEMGGFNQIIDVSNVGEGQFRVSVFAKAESENVNISRVRLFASVSTPGEAAFQENVSITSSEWREYSIEGRISENSDKLILGGYYYGIGKYYFDNFELGIKGSNGEWRIIDIANSGFEDELLDNFRKTTPIFNKWIFGKGDGFEHSITINNPFAGKQALLINGSSRTKNGNFVNVNGINLYYEFHGYGRDTVLFLHGNGQSIKSFSKQIPVFSKQFTVLAMDSRAQGYTSDDGREITYELMAEDVNSLLDNLKIKRINILGWSDGGNTGLILAMNYPSKVNKLAVMGANLFCDTSSVDAPITEQLRRQQDKLERENTPSANYQLRMIHLLLNEPRLSPQDLRSIRCNTLVMAGSSDLIKEKHTKLIAENIRQSKLVIFKGGTHFEPQRNPDRFNKVVIDFFKAGNRSETNK